MLRLDKITRREFLRRSSVVSVAGAAAPWALNLAAIGEAAAQSAGDYRAIVCVFLYGGNDHGNTLVPYDLASYNEYARIRQTLATPRNDLAATALAPAAPLPSGREMALAPQLAPLKPIFDGGKLGVVLNIGPLIQPTSLAQYNARNVPLPPKLFSHNDQQSVWQSSLPEGATSGWGGRIGDLFLNSNGNATFTCVNVSGNAVFMAGQQAVQYQVSPSGAVSVAALRTNPPRLFTSTQCADALRTLITAPSSQPFESAHTTVMSRAIAASTTLANVTATTFQTRLPAGNGLASQLQMVARMIANRATTGATRQVFLVALGGFDNHDFLTTQHPPLLTQTADALRYFYDVTVELGLANNVTTFTASDFGRTLTSNGDGSDHGWGSYHFVLGGAVRGQRYYGAPPTIAVNGPDDVGQGRLLPTLAVDQFAATLAKWMGVSDTEMPSVVPNIANFTQRDLGFLA